jgi:hypothetical protein
MTNGLAVAGSNSKYKEPNAKPAGFLGRSLALHNRSMAFLVSLFAAGVSIYETNNNGHWYEFGFVVGIGVCAGGTDASTNTGASNPIRHVG